MTVEWRIDYTSGAQHFGTLSVGDPFGWSGGTLSASSYTQPRVIEAPRKRPFPALPVAIGHAVFFLALALAGWLR